MEVCLKEGLSEYKLSKYQNLGLTINKLYKVVRSYGYGYTVTVPKVGDRDVAREDFEMVPDAAIDRAIALEDCILVRPKSNQSNKADGGKSNPLLLEEDMVHALEAVNRVLDYGAEKYERAGWKKVELERYIAAMLRHQRAWLKGELIDDESGLPHIAHIACNALFLLQMYADVQLAKGKYVEMLTYNKPPQEHKK